MAPSRKEAVRHLLGYFNPTTLAGFCLLAIVAILALYPLSLIILNSFQVSRPGAEAAYGLEGWRAVFQPAIWKSLYNTFIRSPSCSPG
jgi:ABC-type Fe3+ transport system permease subunit